MPIKIIIILILYYNLKNYLKYKNILGDSIANPLFYIKLHLLIISDLVSPVIYYFN